MRLLVAIALYAAPLGAQIPDIAGTDTTSLWMVRGSDTVAIGFVRDERTTRQESGVVLLYRVMLTDAMFFGPRVDTIITRLDTGMPVRYIGATPRRVERVDIAEGRARGRITGAAGAPIDLDLALPDSTVIATNIDLALRNRLLRQGEVIPLEVFVPTLGTVGTVGMRVEGEEAVDGHRTWRIRAVNLQSQNTLWISQRDRSVRRQTMLGPNGVLLLFDRRTLPPPPTRP